MDKKLSEARRHQEDAALNHGLIWVGAAIVLELLLLLVNRYYINYAVTLEAVTLAELIGNSLRVLRIGGAVVSVLALVWTAIRFNKGEKTALSGILTMAGAALAICAHVAVTHKESGLRMLYLMVPAWAGLALIYYLYHKEFFLAAAVSGVSILGLWFVRFGSDTTVVLLLVGIVLLLSALSIWLKMKRGVLCSNGAPIQVLPKESSYALLLASCVVSLLLLGAGMLLGATVAYYLIFVMVAWLFVLLVYYTVKLL